MESDNIKTLSRFSLDLSRAHWVIVVTLLLLALVSYLNSQAAGPLDQEQAPALNAGLSLPTNTSSPTATTRAGVTLVPNLAVRAFQEDTATPTTIPDTATPTSEPTDTPEPTNTPEPTATAVPTPTNTPKPTAIPPTVAPFQAFAWVDNYYPAPGSVVTAYGRLFLNGVPVNGAQMGVTWRYINGEAYCTAYTGADGRAACAQNIGASPQNTWVGIDVIFIYQDQLYYAKTAFLTDP